MAFIHVLAAEQGTFQCVIHTPVPAGSNTATFTWKNVFLASGRSGTSALTEGLLPGQIATAEKATIVAGDVLEISASINLDSGGITVAEMRATLLAEVERIVAETVAGWKRDLRFWGATR